ncbi:uncharacterized protein (DUF1330 family) [Paraburkholderia sp. GAS41]|uniref:DUF1330 domain-containing protein n=1 Tax=Paraburkholderia sp. GAS41 TaxID=3035134 RepID=UPI003D1A1DE8
MAKSYWVSAYRKVFKPEQLAEYSKLATPAILAGGGRILARGVAAFAHGAGIAERTVLIEFDSLEKAVAAFESAEYQAAVKVLGDAVERDFRIVEGAE